jgi:methylated-DNA-[protein]-cysteine S-methyltransferase
VSIRDLRSLGTRIPAQPGDGAEARERLIEAARRNDLLDVGYSFADSPFGPLLVAVTGRGLVRLAYPNESMDDVLWQLGRSVSPRVLESPRDTSEVRRELDQYFDGHRTEFDVPVDLGAMGGFRRRVLEAAERIPFGQVRSYTEVASDAGSPRGARAAGNALGSNPIPIVVPCHRVVHAGGGLGGYTGGLSRKVTLLTLEGVLEPEGRIGARRTAADHGGRAAGHGGTAAGPRQQRLRFE